MIGLTVTGGQRVADNLRTAKGALRSAQQSGVRRSVAIVQRALRTEMSEQGAMDPFWGKKGSRGDGLATRTGRTRASITGATFTVGERVVGVVGSKEPHLKQHEDGGTVRGGSPRGFNRVPTAAALTPAGVDRNAGRSIRDIPGTFLFRSARGHLWAAVRTYGSGAKMIRGKQARANFFSAQSGMVGKTTGGLVLLYLLVRQITLKPRRIFDRVRKQSQPQVIETMRADVSLVVQRANA